MRKHFRVPPFAKEREGRGTHSVGAASEIKSLGQPAAERLAVLDQFYYAISPRIGRVRASE
jgi:hypothetical protein